MAVLRITAVLLLATVSNVFCHQDEHLQAISGDCSKLRPLKDVKLNQLHGQTWIVLNDSYIESPEEVCEKLSLKVEGNKLFSTETVELASGKSWTITANFVEDPTRKGFYIEDHADLTAVVLTADKDVNGLCFAECGKMEDGKPGFGAHVFCATMDGKLTQEQAALFDEAADNLKKMEIDVTLNQLKTQCK